MITQRELHLLPPQFYFSSPRYIASSVEALASKSASTAFSDEIGGEGVIELPCSHLAFVLGQVHHFESIWVRWCVGVLGEIEKTVEAESPIPGGKEAARV